MKLYFLTVVACVFMLVHQTHGQVRATEVGDAGKHVLYIYSSYNINKQCLGATRSSDPLFYKCPD